MKLIAEKSATVDIAGDAGLTLDGASPAPVIITEQEVLLGTAAAMPVQQPKTNHRFARATLVVVAAFQHRGVTSAADARPRQRDYPSRLGYLERSAMARAMERL